MDASLGSRLGERLPLPATDDVVAAVVGKKRLRHFRFPKTTLILVPLVAGISAGIDLDRGATLLASVAAAVLGSVIDGWRMVTGSDDRQRQAEEAYTDPTYVAVTRSTVWIGPWRDGLADITGVERLPKGSVSARRSSKTVFGFEAHRVLLLTFEDGRPDLELIVGGSVAPLVEVVDAISRSS